MTDPLDAVVSCLQKNDLVGATRLCEGLVQRDPGNGDFWHVFGVVEHKKGENARAIEFVEKAISLLPAEAQFRYNLGVMCMECGEKTEAEMAYREALRLEPAHTAASNNLGNLLMARGEFGGALDAYKVMAEAEPTSGKALQLVGLALKMIGDVGAALASLEKAKDLDPGNPLIESDFVFTHQYEIGITAERIGEVSREWDRRHGAGAGHEFPKRDSQKQIRLGFVSPDLGHHPVGIFLAPLLGRLDRERFQITCYSERSDMDSMTERIQGLSNFWRNVKGATDEALGAQIEKDGIDILFDLTGHTDNNRMALFARRAAPLQLTWGGYVGSTGLAQMDGIICDHFHVPEEAEEHYTERPIRLGHDYIGYEPPAYAPDIGEVPSLAAGKVTFGCFNNPTKVNALVAEVWAEIFEKVPNSRLFLKYKGFDDPAVQERIYRIFRECGVAEERIEMRGATQHVHHLEAYGEVDVVLDPFPYSGGLTTCEALWMGVPTVTWPGDTFASRHSLAHMTNAGFTDTIADGRESYVRIAVELAEDVERRAELRKGMREVVSKSPLCDLDGHASSFSREVERAWQRWCSGKENDLKGRKVGMLGLGLMGRPMGKLIAEAGADLVVWNRSTAPLDELVEQGARVAASPAELATMMKGEVIILSLKDAAAVREVADGAGGLLGGIQPGTTVVDMGTTSLEVTRWLAEELSARGCSLVDAPVSGGVKGATEGELTVMVGASEEDFDRVGAILDVLGGRVSRMGESGAGQVTKLANQLMVASNLCAVAEALRIAEAAGLEPGKVREALRGGFAESRVLEMHGARMIRGDFEPGGKATGQLKDLRYAADLAGELGIELPGLEAQVTVWQRMVDAGMGELDHSGIYAYLGEANNRPG